MANHLDLTTLNPQQQKAITASDGPVLVLAGPGSGKTRVLTHRVAWLVLEKDVAPWRVMAVTFTNKAAREMRERLEQILGSAQAHRLTLGTFHATCARILRREAETIGISRDYVIFDTDDQLALIRKTLRELNIDPKRYSPAAIHGAISRAKNELITPDAYQPRSYFGEIVRRVYARYQEQLRANSALDFDDLLVETVCLFRDHTDVLQTYQERYRHILVDEFQDTNMVQYVLLRQLSGRYRNLFVVADEDQSIYAWRGADYRNIARLRDDHPDLITYLLEQNYRSSQTILDAAQAIIRHNPERTEKKLFTQRGRGLKVSVHEAYDQEEEANFVVQTISRLTRTQEAEAGHFAVMYRTNAQSRALEDAFIRAGMPYRLVGATRFYARREIKDLIAYLRLIHNPADSASLGRVINVPSRGIGQKTLQALEQATEARGEPLWWAVQATASGQRGAPDLGSRARAAVTAFYRLVHGWIEQRGEMTPGDLLDRVLQETGYESTLRDGTDEGEERWANVLELQAVAAGYAELTLTEFLADVALVSDVDNMTTEANAPTLLTLHSAKGLEFPIVFITGLEEGLLPHSRSLDDPDQLAEERRLMYVGVTRAESRLYLTHAFRRAHYGSYEPSVPSRLLAEIPANLIEGVQVRTTSISQATATSWTSSWESAPAARFSEGDRVRHSVFGTGLVVESRVRSGEEEVTVVFDRGGIKRIMASFLEQGK